MQCGVIVYCILECVSTRANTVYLIWTNVLYPIGNFVVHFPNYFHLFDPFLYCHFIPQWSRVYNCLSLHFTSINHYVFHSFILQTERGFVSLTSSIVVYNHWVSSLPQIFYFSICFEKGDWPHGDGLKLYITISYISYSMPMVHFHHEMVCGFSIQSNSYLNTVSDLV